MNKLKLPSLLIIATAFLSLSATIASAQLLLTDDFNAGGTHYYTPSDPSSAANGNIENRQSGSLSTSLYTVNSGTNVQLGNTVTDLGQPGGATNGDYLLLYNAAVQNNLVIDADLANGKALEFSFNLYVGGTNTYYGAFFLGESGTTGVDNVSGSRFGWRVSGDGTLYAYNESSDVNTNPTDPWYYSSSGFDRSGNYLWKIVFSDVADGGAGTGSSFDGNGTYVSIYYNDVLIHGNELTEFAADDSLRFGFLSKAVSSGGATGVDNLSVAAVPEPATTSLLVAVGIGLTAVARKRRRS